MKHTETYSLIYAVVNLVKQVSHFGLFIGLFIVFGFFTPKSSLVFFSAAFFQLQDRVDKAELHVKIRHQHPSASGECTLNLSVLLFQER